MTDGSYVTVSEIFHTVL